MSKRRQLLRNPTPGLRVLVPVFEVTGLSALVAVAASAWTEARSRDIFSTEPRKASTVCQAIRVADDRKARRRSTVAMTTSSHSGPAHQITVTSRSLPRGRCQWNCPYCSLPDFDRLASNSGRQTNRVLSECSARFWRPHGDDTWFNIRIVIVQWASFAKIEHKSVILVASGTFNVCLDNASSLDASPIGCEPFASSHPMLFSAAPALEH